MRRMDSWFAAIVVGLVLAVLASFVFGIDAVLNMISTIFAVGVVAILVAVMAAFLAAIGWVVVRDAIDEIKSDRQEGRPWLWRCVGLAGIAGIILDGIVGAWNVYQKHILFSTAVEEIPFAGVPVLMALGAYPFKWIEALVLRWHKAPR